MARWGRSPTKGGPMAPRLLHSRLVAATSRAAGRQHRITLMPTANRSSSSSTLQDAQALKRREVAFSLRVQVLFVEHALRCRRRRWRRRMTQLLLVLTLDETATYIPLTLTASCDPSADPAGPSSSSFPVVGPQTSAISHTTETKTSRFPLSIFLWPFLDFLPN